MLVKTGPQSTKRLVAQILKATPSVKRLVCCSTRMEDENGQEGIRGRVAKPYPSAVYWKILKYLSDNFHHKFVDPNLIMGPKFGKIEVMLNLLEY